MVDPTDGPGTLRLMDTLSGTWLGTISGTNSASLQITLHQDGQRLSGTAIIYEPIIGKYAYKVAGRVGTPVSFRLSIAEGHPHQMLGTVDAVLDHSSGTRATGKWQSSNGAHGSFELEKMVQSPAAAHSNTVVDTSRDKVFIAHGHDEGLREAVARFTQNLLGTSPVILEERANKGRALIEKFEQESTAASYAITIATPDDVGYSIKEGPEHAKPRTRENVWFELGFFAGRIGRDRTCLLYRGNVNMPSDLGGIAYIPADNPDTWKLRLARELHGAGFKINTETALL